MQLIKMEPLENGAHENRSTPWETTVPEGWACIPEEMEVPESFPFVDIEAADVDGVPTVTAMTAREVPAEEPAEEPPTLEAQVAALQEQNKLLTQCLLEMSETVYA